MSDKAKTLIVVTLITLLIWTYAESQSIQLRPFPSVLLQIPAPTSTEHGASVVWLTESEGSNFQVNLEIEGSAVSIDRIRTDLDDAIDLTASAAFPSDPGTYTLELDELLREHPIFQDSGLTFLVEPPTVQVEVDTIKRVELPVVVPGIDGVEIQSTITMAHLALPRSVWEIHRDTVTELRLRTDQIDVSSLETGLRTSLPAVLIEKPTVIEDSPFFEISPASVAVRATLIVPQGTHEIPTVRFYLGMPTDQVGKWHVTIKVGDDDFLRNVTVTGPKDLVDQIADPTSGLAVNAVVHLTQDQLDGPATTGSAVFGLTGGITSNELRFAMEGAEMADVPVQLTITPVIEAPVEAGGAGDGGGAPLQDNSGGEG